MTDWQGPNMSRAWNLEIGQKLLSIIREERNKIMNRTMTGTQIFEAYQQIDQLHQDYLVSANVQYEGRNWNISGMNARGELDLVILDTRETTSINAAEMPLPVEFVLNPLEDQFVG